MNDLRDDGFLNGRLRIWQPARGFRSGADAVMLAAACPAQSGQTVLDLGCGVGVAGLCLAARVPGVVLTGLELQSDYAELARRNAHRNDVVMRIVTGDLADLPPDLRDVSFDHVLTNPPYFLAGTPAPDADRSLARQEALPLADWIDRALRRLRPGGTLTLIQRADRLDTVLCGLAGRAGSVTVLPVSARAGREAGRVIVTARKGARTPMRLLAPFIMHDSPSHAGDGEDLSPAASAILREGCDLASRFAKQP